MESAVWETLVQSQDWEDPLEKGTATHFSIFICKILWMEGRTDYGPWSCRVRHDQVTNTTIYVYVGVCTYVYMYAYIHTYSFLFFSIINYFNLLNILTIYVCCWSLLYMFSLVHSVAQSCLTICNPRTAAHQASLSITNS